jgi:ADP-heptose:LPS heptosyltransferase
MLEIPGVRFFGLQSGPEHEELSQCMASAHDLHQHVSTIHDTAQVLQALQLVISVDTMMAHLAGALAVPVWTLLPYECDWRWMLEREDSPWYPSMRLFRQALPGKWSAAVSRLTQALSEFTSTQCRVPQQSPESISRLLQER